MSETRLGLQLGAAAWGLSVCMLSMLAGGAERVRCGWTTLRLGKLCVAAGWGLCVCMLSMLAGGAVEAVRLGKFKQGDVLTHDRNAIVDMSVFWQVPQYILVGLSEVRNLTQNCCSVHPHSLSTPLRGCLG